MSAKTVVLENVSKRLWIVGHINIAPTAAVAVPESVYKEISVQNAIEEGELKVVDQEKDPKIIKTEEEARQLKIDQKRTPKSE